MGGLQPPHHASTRRGSDHALDDGGHLLPRMQLVHRGQLDLEGPEADGTPAQGLILCCTTLQRRANISRGLALAPLRIP